MLLKNLPVGASLSSLDFSKHPFRLIFFNTSIERENGPVWAPNVPTLEFEVIGDGTNAIELQNIYL